MNIRIAHAGTCRIPELSPSKGLSSHSDIGLPETERSWYEDTRSEPSVPAVGSDGTVYVSCKSGCLEAFRDDNLLWTAETCPSPSRPAAGPDGKVYLTGENGGLQAFRNGGLLWTAETCEHPSGPAVGPDGTVYVAGESGRLEAFRNGELLWTREIHEHPSCPVVGPGGMVYVASEDGYIEAIGGVGRFGEAHESPGNQIREGIGIHDGYIVAGRVEVGKSR